MPARLERLRPLIGTASELGRELRALPAEARRHRPRPPASGLVLDIGAGQSPHPRADVVVEKYPADDFERPGEASLSLAKPLVVADGEQLPFADLSFAYVIALHVLEHAPDPARFAGELARVAPAGFVQVPSRESELVYGWPYHPWLIDRTDRGLRFRPHERAHPPHDFMHEHFGESVLHRLAWAAHRSRWHHSIAWQGRLEVEVEGESVADRAAEVDVERTRAVLDEFSPPPLTRAVRAALRCPHCRSALSDAPGRLDCEGCDRSYPVVGGAPLLLAEAADRGGAASTRS
jgi:SAM-dependent methyltransferase